ncbi:hypothetical protein YC2023_098779 [Brassica napus]
MLTLESMPEDMHLLIVSKVSSTSPIDYFNTIITCKSLGFSSENFSVANDLNLSRLVKKPALANKYKTLVETCIKANNVDAHFVKGMLEYFQSQNQILGQHHIHTASEGGHLQGRYVYGVLLMAIGQTEKGRSLEHPLLHMKDIYVSSILKMWPDLNCHSQEEVDNTVCANCFHFFLLTKFYKMMLGFNDLQD